MKKFFVLLNHELTVAQKDEIMGMDADEIVLPSENIKIFWKNVAPDGELPIDSLRSVTDWLGVGGIGDYVLAQGDFGATFYVVSWCFDNGLIPVYSTTKRVFESERLGDAFVNKHKVKHINFRKYVRGR